MAEHEDPKNLHVVEPGDRLSRIAARHGYASTAAIWDAAENAALKKRRANPEVLMPGIDKVFLPEKKAEEHAAPEKKVSTLAQEGIPSEVRIKLTFGGKPIAPKGKVRVRIDSEPYSPAAPYVGEVTLDGGVARFHVDPLVTEVVLACDDPAFTVRLRLGHLQPIDEDKGVGVEQRLTSLGYRCPTTLPAGAAGSATHGKALEAHGKARDAAAARFLAIGKGERVRLAATRGALVKAGQP